MSMATSVLSNAISRSSGLGRDDHLTTLSQRMAGTISHVIMIADEVRPSAEQADMIARIIGQSMPDWLNELPKPQVRLVFNTVMSFNHEYLTATQQSVMERVLIHTISNLETRRADAERVAYLEAALIPALHQTLSAVPTSSTMAQLNEPNRQLSRSFNITVSQLMRTTWHVVFTNGEVLAQALDRAVASAFAPRQVASTAAVSTVGGSSVSGGGSSPGIISPPPGGGNIPGGGGDTPGGGGDPR